jgi:hypothetical protein
VVNHLGLWKGLLVGGTFNVSGALLRWTYRKDYATVYLGTLLAAYAQTFTLSTPPLIANRWFGSQERATATALGVLANQFGTAVGLGVTAVVNLEVEWHDYDDFSIPTTTTTIATTIDEERLQRYLLVQAVVAAVALFLVAIFVSDDPPSPPNKAAASFAPTTVTVTSCESNATKGKGSVEESTPLISPVIPEISTSSSRHCHRRAKVSYGNSIRQIFGSLSNISFMCAFGMTVGVFYTIPAFLGQLLALVPSHDDGGSSHGAATTAGWLGILYQCGGIIGSLGAGRLVDVTQQHRPVYLGLLFLAAFALGILTVGLTVSSAEPATQRIIGESRSSGSVGIITTAAGVLLAGCGLAAVNTVGLDYGTAIVYPADEMAVAGVMECAAELFGFVWVTVGGAIMSAMVDVESKLLWFGFLLVAAVLSSFVITQAKDNPVKRPI